MRASPWSRAIKPFIVTSAWVLLYLALIVMPLVPLVLGTPPRGGGFWWDFALVLGYAVMAMMGVQFWLTARFKRATAPFGIDIIYVFHRYLASIGAALLLLHVGILLVMHPDAIGSFDPRVAPGYLTLGWLALLAILVVIVSSLWRKPLGIEYDRWRRVHGPLAVIAILCGMLHIQGSGSYLNEPWKRWLWSALALSWLVLIAWVRLLRPWLLQRRPYRVVEVRREPGRNWSLFLEPAQGRVLEHRPGQFAWLSLRASPFALREHPFSIASAPAPGRPLQFAIKELGDFTETIGGIRVGEIAYVDGPYGNFSIDRHAKAGGYVFVAGGVGIAPIISMLRALTDRGDRRPLWLFYGNRRIERVLFADELDELARKLDLRVVHVLGEAAPEWNGERGVIDLDLMRRHLPEQLQGLHCFVCGPTAMIRLVERNLATMGLPLRHLHSEIFDLA